MRCGVLAGDSVAAIMSDRVKPLYFYDDYKNWDDEKDEAQWKNDKKFIDQTIEQIFTALDELKVKKEKAVFEYYVSLEDQNASQIVGAGHGDYETGDTFYLADYNGELNGGNYSVIFIDMSASW